MYNIKKEESASKKRDNTITVAKEQKNTYKRSIDFSHTFKSAKLE